MIEVEAPDGTVIEFPDGTADQTIKSVMAKNYPAPSLIDRMTTRPSAVMAGGATGGLLGAKYGALAGAPFGPPGMAIGGAVGGLGGGALGAAAGSLGYDVFNRPKDDSPLGPVKRAANEAYEDTIWGGGFAALGPITKRIGKPLVGKLLGVNNEATRKTVDEAADQGIELGAAHVSKRGFVRGAPGAMGVFPFVGTPVREGQGRVVGQIDDAAADLLNTIAPASARQDVAAGLAKGAKGRFNASNRIASALYNRFYDLAEQLPQKEIIPTENVRKALAEIKAVEAKEAIAGVRKPGQDQIGEYIDQLSNLPEKITVEQARGLQRELNSFAKQMRVDGYDVSRLATMAENIKAAIHTPDVSGLPPEQAQEVVSALEKANRYFSQSRSLFDSPTAQKFARADRNIFKKGPGKPGSINEDELFDSVYKAKSPEALEDLSKLVGGPRYRQATRSFIEREYKKAVIPAKEGAVVGDMFSAQQFEKSLGLNTPEGRKSFEAMLSGTMTDPKDWYKFLDAAKKGTDIVVRDPSTFVMRRMVLGGGLAGSVAMGAGHISIPAAALLTLAARKGAKFLMDPGQLRLMTRVMEDTASDKQKRALVGRLFEGMGDNKE